MLLLTRTVTLATLVLTGFGAHAWGPDGHQTVGVIADRLIAGTPAAAQVKSLLDGLTLRDAADWADCAKGIGPAPAYAYADAGKHPACKPFETKKGIAEMRDFVRRNEKNCKRSGHDSICHFLYHYTDIALQRGHYESGFTGARDVDIVAASAAAIRVLEGQPAPAPFSFKSKREALLLLAHYAGDIHQPLHVGAPYLDAAGRRIDPDPGPAPKGSATSGGNDLVAVDVVTKKLIDKMHAMWDDVPAALAPQHVDDAWLAQARAVQADTGDAAEWPAGWASASVAAAQQAYDKVRFGAKHDSVWNATLPLHYRDRMTALKKAQLTLAGAHLAHLLQTVLP